MRPLEDKECSLISDKKNKSLPDPFYPTVTRDLSIQTLAPNWHSLRKDLCLRISFCIKFDFHPALRYGFTQAHPSASLTPQDFAKCILLADQLISSGPLIFICYCCSSQLEWFCPSTYHGKWPSTNARHLLCFTSMSATTCHVRLSLLYQ